MFHRMSLNGFAVVVLALLTACETLPVSQPDASNPIVKVAVLPIHNFTANMDGPVWIRCGISEMVHARHYIVIPNDQVDMILKENMGVTLGGQLDYMNPATGAPSPNIVGQSLDVDGLIYCNLEDFQNTVTLVFNRRKVKIKCSLVNVKTADIVWEQEEEKSAVEINARPEDIPRALFTVLRPNPLKGEMAAVINKMRDAIPCGPVADAEE